MKGQTAMEYLMTYGWAILIIIIVAGALYALGVFNPATYTGSRATGFATLGAPTEWLYDSGVKQLKVTFKNGLGESITFTEINATINGKTVTGTGSTDPISPGSTTTYTFDFSGNDPGITSGGSYSSSIKILYKKVGGTLDLVETGTITGVAA